MRGIRIERWCLPHELRVTEVPEPVCGPADVRIRVRAVPVSHSLWLLIQGKYQRRPAFPFVPGSFAAGEVIECGAQATGGNCLADWRSVPNLADVGYPIAEMQGDGSCVITKHAGTGGRISRQSVTEQLVYEIGDPRAYITGDVVSDFTSIHLEDLGGDRVRLSGMKGRAPSGKLKVSAAYRDGFKAVGTLVYAWPDARDKAMAAARILRERIDRLGLRFDAVHVEVIGAGAVHGALAGPDAGHDAPEVQLRYGVQIGRAHV